MKHCGRCKKATPRRGQSYCRKCHNAYQREWRKNNPHRALPDKTRKHANARAYANTYLRRGLIARKPCEVCGARAQMHHDDYDKPLEVRWLCRPHHLAHHQAQKRRLPAAA